MTHDRVEKYKGVTLVVRDGWITVIWDATGHTVMGSVSSEDEVWHVTRIAIDTLRQIAAVMEARQLIEPKPEPEESAP